MDKDRIIAISKSDLINKSRIKEIGLEIEKNIKNIPYCFISSVSNFGLTELKDDLWKVLNN